MIYDELYHDVQQILPNATLDQDNHGQIIIYTNLMIGPDGLNLVPLKIDAQDPSTLFENDYFDDPHLARSFLADPFKDPQQKAQARDYLERNGYSID